MSQKIRLENFVSVLPEFSLPQEQALSWLAAAHTRAEVLFNNPDFDPVKYRQRMLERLSRFGCSPEHISNRNVEIRDFLLDDLDEMRIFGRAGAPEGPGASERTAFYEETVDRVFEKIYLTEKTAPTGLIHVTCTGYISPSPAQKLVIKRGWHEQTYVSHTYHMGCYAAVPATRIAASLVASSVDKNPRVDIVHTEICTLHFNPTLKDPGQLVTQTLFADGHIRYSATAEKPSEPKPGLVILSTREEMIPGTEKLMTWRTGTFGMEMTLGRDVPAMIAKHILNFIQSLAEKAEIDLANDKIHFAIHPGGPKIIEAVAEILGLATHQYSHSQAVLRDHGNMSSATLPHIWQRILSDSSIQPGTNIISMAFGPGLTIAGMALRKSGP